MLCHEAYGSKRSVTGAGGHGVWPLRASSLPRLPLQASSCPRQLHFGRGRERALSHTQPALAPTPLVPGSVFRKHSSDSAGAGHRAEAAVHTEVQACSFQLTAGEPQRSRLGWAALPVENRSVGSKPCDSPLRIGREGSSEVLCYNPALYS